METRTRTYELPQELTSQLLMHIILEYITKVNSRYRGNEFTSSQLTKIAMAVTELEKTKFPTIHRTVKAILEKWEQEGLCAHIARTKYSRCRRTKDTYRFNNKGLTEIKKQAIDETMKTINENELTPIPIMRTREYIIRDRLEELLSTMTGNHIPIEDEEP